MKQEFHMTDPPILFPSNPSHINPMHFIPSQCNPVQANPSQSKIRARRLLRKHGYEPHRNPHCNPRGRRGSRRVHSTNPIAMGEQAVGRSAVGRSAAGGRSGARSVGGRPADPEFSDRISRIFGSKNSGYIQIFPGCIQNFRI